MVSSLLELIGNTPLVRLDRFWPGKPPILGKICIVPTGGIPAEASGTPGSATDLEVVRRGSGGAYETTGETIATVYNVGGEVEEPVSGIKYISIHRTELGDWYVTVVRC